MAAEPQVAVDPVLVAGTDVTPPSGGRRSATAVKGWRLAGRYAVLTAVAAVVFLPIYTALVGSLKPGVQFLDVPRSLLPVDLTLATLRDAWSTGRLGRYLLNSVVATAVIVIGQLLTSILAAYAFAFLEFRLKRVLFGVFIATLAVPAEVTVLGNFDTMRAWGWTDTYQGLTAPFLATAFGTFLLRQVFMTLPGELREAARLDGVGHWRYLWGVAVPLARPTIGALGVFAFLGAWNQYLWPLWVTTNDTHRTVQIGLKTLAAANIDKPNLVLAGSVIAALPIFLILLFFQRQLVRGLTAGAVKG